MKLSALDIRKQEFARTFRGYDPEEVESFLQVVATGWQELVDDLRRAQDKINEQQMKLEHYMKVEEAREEALQTARSSARQTIESAEKKASDMLQEAENRVVNLQREADANRLDVKREAARYAVRQQEIVAKLRAFLVSEMEMLRHFETDTGERTLAGGAPRKEIEMHREEEAPETMAV
jgi:cell division initiation protein